MPARCNSPDGFNFAQLRPSKRKEKEHERLDAETEEQRKFRLQKMREKEHERRDGETEKVECITPSQKHLFG